MDSEKFDRSKLTEEDNKVLTDFSARRIIFDKFVKDKKIDACTCPGCGYPSLEERGGYEVCDVCNWEDDNQDDEHADEVWGGPNSVLSLTENRLNIGKELRTLAERLNGELNTDPEDVFSILTHHKERMDRMSRNISPTALASDPVWTEWRSESKKILEELIRIK